MFRASQVGSLMAYPDKDTLPKGAINYLETLVSQHLLNWQDEIDMLALEKGIAVENESIDLFNLVMGKQLSKNTERKDNGLITGECDLLDGNTIWDIKSSYSKKTHKMFIDLKDNKLYFWQLVSYAELWDIEYAGLARCLVSTPEHLINKRDNPTWHFVDHIEPSYRVTTAKMQVTQEQREQLINRVKLAKNKLDAMIFERVMNV
jgi:hypothetical protein